jgi:predicted enzyme related to lactoylglutathione lyase
MGWLFVSSRGTLTGYEEAQMTLNLQTIMLGSEDSKRLAGFYSDLLGSPEPQWSDESGGWYGFQVGDGSVMIGPHSEVHGRNAEPGRIVLNLTTSDVKGEFNRIKGLGAEVVAEPYEPAGGEGMLLCTFADPDGNYFQLAPPWESAS